MAALLGKLYISPSSTEEKIRELYAEVSDAVETNMVTDTTGRNALYKIHVSLGKIVNSLDQAQEAGARRRSTLSRSVSLGPDEHMGQPVGGAANRGATVEPQIKEEDEEDGEGGGGGGDEAADMTVRGAGEEEEDEGGDSSAEEGTVIQNNTTAAVEADDGDSLVSELLDDDGDTIMAG